MQMIRRPAITRGYLAGVLAAAAVAAALIAAPAAASATASDAASAAMSTAAQAPASFGGQASLASISCRGPSWCMAVGAYTTTDHVRHAQAMIWNGTTWRTLKNPPGKSLTSVSCSAPWFCMAAGGPTGAERWNGTSWAAMPSPPGGVSGVSCGSRKLCMVIYQGLVRSWNGTTWHLWKPQTDFCTGSAPGPCGLDGVSCASATNCVTVGTWTQSQEPIQNAVSVYWNGTSWTRDYELPARGNPAQLNAVSCTGSFCLATGSSSDDSAGGTVADADTFDATSQSWTSVPPDLGNLCAEFRACYWTAAISCASPTSCMTLGGPDGSQWWNGTGWASARTISAGRGSALQGLSCGGSNCLTVGFRTVAGKRRTLAELWNGSAWTIITTPR